MNINAGPDFPITTGDTLRIRFAGGFHGHWTVISHRHGKTANTAEAVLRAVSSPVRRHGTGKGKPEHIYANRAGWLKGF